MKGKHKNSNRNWGVAIGPTEPNDSSVFNHVLESFQDIDAEECKVKTYDEYNFISVQVPNYEAAKNLTTYKSGDIRVSMVDIEKFDEYAQKFWNLFPTLISNKCADFSRAQSKYKINLERFPPNVSMLLFLALMYSKKTNEEINSFNFSHCGIEREEGFTNILNYFPDLKEINLNGNPVVFDEPEFIFGTARIITDNPNANYDQPSFHKDQTEEVQQNNDDSIFEQPQLVFQDLYLEPTAVTLDMFSSIEFDVDEFPTNGFVCHFFKLMWDKIEECIYYYTKDSVFSVILQHIPQTKCFEDFESDCQGDSAKHYNGNDMIVQILRQLFPSGFKSVVTSMNCSIVGNDIYSVIVHGVFENEEKMVFGFDRSLFIDFYDSSFRILNDNIFIREPPSIEE